MPRRYDQYCALATALDLLGDRWTLLVLRELWTGPKRFRSLEQGLVDSPTNVLSSRLRSLTAHGLVEADVPGDDRRGRVYRISPAARPEIGEVLTSLTRFGVAHMSADPVGARPFHPDWLVLPLEAVLRRDAVRRPLTVRFSTGDTSGQFRISARGVEPSPETEADLTVEGTPDTLLRALRSPQEIGSLVSAGELAVSGDPDAALELQRVLSPTHP